MMNTSVNSSTMNPSIPGCDVLICGSCSSQFSDLKLFIDHKHRCDAFGVTGLASDHCSDPPQTITISAPPSVVTPQPMVSPTTSTSSPIVNFPMGVPHVIVQSSRGVPQMYRLLLEPSTNGASIRTTIGSSEVGNTVTALEIRGQEMSQSTASIEGLDSGLQKVDTFTPVINKVSTEGTTSYESSWSSESRIFDPLQTEEEDVATFLASQLASQSSPNASKLKEEKNYGSVDQRTTTMHLDNNGGEKGIQCSTPNIDASKFVEIKILPPINLSNQQHSIQLHKDNPTSKNRSKLQCEYAECDFSTSYSKDMIRHIRKHTGEKPYDCIVCGKSFSRMDKLKVHHRVHSNERPYTCSVENCNYSATERAHLKKHLRIHSKDRPYKCQMCCYAARDSSQLTVHLRSHTGDAPFHCQVAGCSRTFKTSSDLRRHEKVHTGEKPFKCSHCEYVTALKSNLKVHFTINHSKKGLSFSCKSCHFSGSSKKQLREHSKTHIEEDFVSPRDSSVRQTPRSKPSCVKNFKCDFYMCGSAFVREDSYRSHMRQHQRHNSTALFQKQLSQTNLIKFRDISQSVISFIIDKDESKDTKSSTPVPVVTSSSAPDIMVSSENAIV